MLIVMGGNVLDADIDGTLYLAHCIWVTVFGTLESVFTDLSVRVIADSKRSWDGRSKVTVMVEFEKRL